MRNVNHKRDRPLVIVLGCDEIGSALAHALHGAAHAVVVIDGVDPGWPRRGRSYVDAWYVGGATLEQVDACFCASAKSVGPILARGEMIAATTWSWQGIAELAKPLAVVETRERETTPREIARPPLLDDVLTIGVRTGRVGGWPADIAIAAAPSSHPIAGATRGTVDRCPPVRILAPLAGRFRTRFEISDWVDRGEVIGETGGFAVIAPASGILVALSARGARIAAGQLIAEIDQTPSTGAAFGIEPHARAVAHEVCAAIRRRVADARSGASPDARTEVTS